MGSVAQRFSSFDWSDALIHQGGIHQQGRINVIPITINFFSGGVCFSGKLHVPLTNQVIYVYWAENTYCTLPCQDFAKKTFWFLDDKKRLHRQPYFDVTSCIGSWGKTYKTEEALRRAEFFPQICYYWVWTVENDNMVRWFDFEDICDLSNPCES